MRICVLAMSLAMLAVDTLGAQAIPPVERAPTQASVPVPSTGQTVRMRHAYDSDGRLRATILIDSLFAWATPFDSLELPGVGQARVLGSVRVDDMRSIVILEEDQAMARGSCPGTPLVVIFTKTGRWRPPPGVATSRTRPECRRYVNERGRGSPPHRE